jgi:hypothetical protein
MSYRKKHLVHQVENMSNRQVLPLLIFLYFFRARRFLATTRGFFLIVNIAQIALYLHSLINRPGDLSLITSLVVRVAIVSFLANIPPTRSRTVSL